MSGSDLQVTTVTWVRRVVSYDDIFNIEEILQEGNLFLDRNVGRGNY